MKFFRVCSAFFMLCCATAATALERAGHYEVLEQEVVFAELGGQQLKAHIYRPKTDGILPAVIDVHGGAWNLYDRMAGDLYNRGLASAGLFVLAIDFRQGPDYQHPAASADTAAAVRYLRHHSESLGIDPASIGLVGSSSGAHLALLAGLLPNHSQHQGTAIATRVGEAVQAFRRLDERPASVNYVIALWPVSDPHYRYEYAQRVGRDRLVEFHLGYFADETAMREASIQALLSEGRAETPLPPIMLVQPGADDNIPREMTAALIDAIQQADGQLDYHFYPGMPHAFAHRPSPATDDCIATMIAFIDRQVNNVQEQRKN